MTSRNLPGKIEIQELQQCSVSCMVFDTWCLLNVFSQDLAPVPLHVLCVHVTTAEMAELDILSPTASWLFQPDFSPACYDSLAHPDSQSPHSQGKQLCFKILHCSERGTNLLFLWLSPHYHLIPVYIRPQPRPFWTLKTKKFFPKISSALQDPSCLFTPDLLSMLSDIFSSQLCWEPLSLESSTIPFAFSQAGNHPLTHSSKY